MGYHHSSRMVGGGERSDMNTRRAWFCYEHNFAMHYSPVIYYDELPIKMQGKDMHRVQVVEITDLPVGVDGEFSFAQLQDLYPLQIREDSAIREDKEKEMSRPVSGFLTSQGQFFDTKEEADFYDAAYELNVACLKAVKEHGYEDEEQASSVAEGIQRFISDNASVIEEFLSTKGALDRVSKSRDGVDGHTTGDNPTDDPQVRVRSDSEVAVEEAPEAVPERPRKKSQS